MDRSIDRNLLQIVVVVAIGHRCVAAESSSSVAYKFPDLTYSCGYRTGTDCAWRSLRDYLHTYRDEMTYFHLTKAGTSSKLPYSNHFCKPFWEYDHCLSKWLNYIAVFPSMAFYVDFILESVTCQQSRSAYDDFCVSNTRLCPSSPLKDMPYVITTSFAVI
jgi:hypothetical protein